MDCKQIKNILEPNKKEFENISDTIWGYAELRYKEFKSAALQKEFFQNSGLKITDSLGGIETAFCAEYGSGQPVIAFLGEFDALPNLSQKADCTKQIPLKKGMPGHGCGHNVLGTAAMEAAYTTIEYMKKNKQKGTIRYYGCPAEESGAGKAFMVRAGCFKDVDIALSWHPAAASSLMNNALANARIMYEFKGVSAHAASSPHLGRSALDALELMNVGVNFLREHIIPEARIHYAILDAGGNAPNVVQDYAKALYVVRAPQNKQLKEITERVHKIAQGAALMTETTATHQIVSAYSNIMKNNTLDALMLENAKQLFPLIYTEEEKKYAASFILNMAATNYENSINNTLNTDTNLPPSASTDFGDVTWNVPSSAIVVNCYSKNSVMHSWPIVAQGKSTIAHKGMHTAAIIMAATAVDLLQDNKLIKHAWNDFHNECGKDSYESLIPEDTLPGSF